MGISIAVTMLLPTRYKLMMIAAPVEQFLTVSNSSFEMGLRHIGIFPSSTRVACRCRISSRGAARLRSSREA